MCSSQHAHTHTRAQKKRKVATKLAWRDDREGNAPDRIEERNGPTDAFVPQTRREGRRKKRSANVDDVSGKKKKRKAK